MIFPEQPIPKGVKPLPHVFEVIHYHPDKSDPEATSKKLAAGDVILRKQPDCVGIPIEGVSHEDPTLAVKFIEWKTYEGHMENFRNSEAFKEYKQAIEGARTGPPDVKHYKYYSPLPLKGAAIIEHVKISLKPDVSFEDFYRDWSAGCEAVAKCKGCPGFAWGQQMEDPTIALQTQAWETLEDHTITFKQRPDINEIMAPLQVAVEKYVIGGWKGCSACHLVVSNPEQ